MTDNITTEPSSSAGAVGPVLRQRRLDKNLTTEQAAQDTRINIKFIRNLEEEKWDDFPARVYLEGFLKRYAGYLGLPDEDLLKKLRQVLQVEEKPGFSSPAPRKEAENGSMPSTAARPLGVLAAGAVIALSLALAYVKLSERRADLERPMSVEPLTVTAPTPVAPPPPMPESHEVRVTAASPVWARIWVDGRVKFEGILPAGHNKLWTAEQTLRVTAGNLAALTVAVDGQTLFPQAGGPAGELVWKEPVPEVVPAPPSAAPAVAPTQP